MTITDKAVPNIVGVDIGCGMYTVNLGKTDIDFEKVDEASHFIPSGRNVWDGRKEKFDLTRLKCFRSLKETKWLERSLGTLGGGNHFIEIDEASDGTKYLVIHSGSRNLGKQVAEYYQQLAIELNRGIEDYLEAREEIIRSYKEQGRKMRYRRHLSSCHGISQIRKQQFLRICAICMEGILRTISMMLLYVRALPEEAVKKWLKYLLSIQG